MLVVLVGTYIHYTRSDCAERGVVLDLTATLQPARVPNIVLPVSTPLSWTVIYMHAASRLHMHAIVQSMCRRVVALPFSLEYLALVTMPTIRLKQFHPKGTPVKPLKALKL